MTLTQLEYFCAVCRYHSIKGAADSLFVSSPTISVALKDLENEFHLQLFHHEKNKISLTEEGEAFYKRAETLLKMQEDMYTEFAEMAEETHPLKIGIPPLISTVFFPRMIDTFHETCDIPVQLFEYGSNRAQNLVSTGKLDIALVNMGFYNIDQFESHALMEDSYSLCVSRTHPLADKKSVSLEMLADESLIFYNTDSVQNQTFMTRFRALGIQPHILMHCSQLYTTLNFVRAGTCSAILFSSLAVNPRDFRMIPIEPKIVNKFGIIWKAGNYVPLRTTKFIQFAKGYDITPYVN
jgi:DNA-binding transcriptional LysR family regulator